MAKFRRNHQSSKSSGRILRFGIYAALLFFILMYAWSEISKSTKKSSIRTAVDERFFLPKGGKGQIINHKDFSLSYVEEHEQAEWVAYELTEENLKVPNVKRAKRFEIDPKVSTGSARHNDYTRSGYTRGHLAPAGDMAHDKIAMQESFYMSNISPQLRTFNNGIWKELEETVRDWAFVRDNVIVVAGPVLKDPVKQIGKNKVTVPQKFYKIILDLEEEESIAFLLDHAKSEVPLSDFIVNIDTIEKLTGLDFFGGVLDDEEEDMIESEVITRGWKFSEKRFKLRVEKWNSQ